jgi:hypothetical protein
MLTPEQMLDETRMQERVRRSKIAQHLVINGVDAEGVLIHALRNAKIELKRGDHDVETMIGMAMNAGITDDEVEKARRHFRNTMDLTKVSKAPIRDKNTAVVSAAATTTTGVTKTTVTTTKCAARAAIFTRYAIRPSADTSLKPTTGGSVSTGTTSCTGSTSSRLCTAST